MKLIVATRSPHAIDRIRSALRMWRRRVIDMVRVESWDDLQRELEVSPPGTSLLIDPFLEGREGLERFADLSSRFPLSPIIGYADAEGRSIEDLRKLGRVRMVAALTLHHDDDPSSIIRALERIPRNEPLRALVGVVHDELPEDVALIIRTTILANVPPLTPAELAQRVGLARRTMERRLRDHDLPSPERLIQWGRILNAMRLLEDRGRSGEQVAFSVGYTSAAALGAACRRYLDANLEELRDQGALRRVGEIFLRSLGVEPT